MGSMNSDLSQPGGLSVLTLAGITLIRNVQVELTDWSPKIKQLPKS